MEKHSSIWWFQHVSTRVLIFKSRNENSWSPRTETIRIPTAHGRPVLLSWWQLRFSMTPWRRTIGGGAPWIFVAAGFLIFWMCTVYITMGNHHFSWENSLFLWPYPENIPWTWGKMRETHGSNQEEIRSGSRVGPLAFSGVAGLGSHGKLQKEVELYEMSRKMMASSSFKWKNLWDYHSVNGRFFNIHVSLREGSGLWACVIGRTLWYFIRQSVWWFQTNTNHGWPTGTNTPLSEIWSRIFGRSGMMIWVHVGCGGAWFI